MIRGALIAGLLALSAPSWAGMDTPPPPAYTDAQARAAAPVQSVATQTGNVLAPTICANPSIPSGNTIANTAAETAFATICTIPANTLQPGQGFDVHLAGLYSAGLTQTARGRVRINQNGAPSVATDTAIIDTGPVSGLLNATNQEWLGDVWIIVQTGSTAIDAQGSLSFQTGANSTATTPTGNVNTYTIDPTKPLLLYASVQWGAAQAANAMTLRMMVAK